MASPLTLHLPASMSYTADSPGAVARPIEDKLGEAPISLLDMMSAADAQDIRDGTQTRDFSGDLQALLDYIRIAEPVVCSFSTTDLMGDSLNSAFRLKGAGLRQTFLRSEVTTGPMLKFTHELAGTATEEDTPGYESSGYYAGLELTGFFLAPNGLAPNADGIFIENAYNGSINQVECSGFRYGLHIGAFSNPDIDTTGLFKVRNCRFITNKNGIFARTTTPGGMVLSHFELESSWFLSQKEDALDLSGFDQLVLRRNAIVGNGTATTGTTAGVDAWGGVRVRNLGVTSRNFVSEYNEYGNGNRAYTMRVDAIANMTSSHDRFVTNAASFDSPTPKQIILGDGVGTVRNVRIEKPMLVCDATVTQTFLSLAANVTPGSNVRLLDPDLLDWPTAGDDATRTLVSDKSRMAEIRHGGHAANREAPRRTATYSGTGINITPDNGAVHRIVLGGAAVTISAVSAGSGGVREGETLDLVIENQTAGAVAVTWPANVVSTGFTAPGAGKAVSGRLMYFSNAAKWVPLGAWTPEFTL